MEAGAESWLGWRRDFYNGYGDRFEFYDGGDVAVSVLRVTSYIDGIAILTETSCYREDGTLAFLLTEMASPNLATAFDDEPDDDALGIPSLTREGRIYVAPDGGIIQIVTAIRADGVEVAAMDNDDYRLARDCSPAELYPTTEDVRRRIESELGDIEGKHPPFTAQSLNWCAEH